MSKLNLLAIGLMLLTGLGLLVGRPSPVMAQSGTPMPTPDPTVQALQNEVLLLKTQVATFNDKVDVHQKIVQVEAARQLLPWLAGAAAVAAIGAVVGIGSLGFFTQRAQAIAQQAEERAQVLVAQTQTKADALTREMLLKIETDNQRLVAALQKQLEDRLRLAFYRADPTYMPIHVPETLAQESNRLKLLGFEGVRLYPHLTRNQLQGVVIVRINSVEELETVAAFIKTEKANPRQVAFIIWIVGHIAGATEKVSEIANGGFDSITIANTIVTIATHIYALARGLTLATPQ